MAALKLFPRATGWRRVLLVTTAAGAAAALAALAVSTLVSGSPAAASAAVGGGGALAFSFLSLALIDWADRHAPHLAIPLFMIGFGVKVAVLAVVVLLVRPGDWLDPGWAVGSCVVVVLVWQAAEILSFSKMRISVQPED
ncbi:MAG: hypothetical protein ACTMHH_07760 [Nesterenkonia sp.]